MLTVENITLKSGRQLVRTKSDSGFKICQNGTNLVFDEAIDPIDSGRTYKETEEKIEHVEHEAPFFASVQEN